MEEEYSNIIIKLRALDNETKFTILKYLVNEGAKSITDISKDLKINFSTAHKYLESLEKAGLINSRQEIHNRLKRIFYVSPFNIELSPAKLSFTRKESSEKPTFELILNDGSITKFNEDKFIKKYIESGLPQKTIDNTLDIVYNNVYNKITLIELKKLFTETLSERVNIINASLINFSRIEGIKRNYLNLMNITQPEAIYKHINGKIFIQNLGEPLLLNFVHDLRAISVHGVSGKIPTNIEEYFEDILFAVKSTAEYTKGAHLLEGLNLFIAPYINNLSDEEIKNKIKKFLSELNKLDIDIYISLEIGIPRYSKYVSDKYYSGIIYKTYSEVATKIAPIIINEINNQDKITSVIKIWNKNPNINLDIKKPTYIANMNPTWQDEGASYCGNEARFGTEWKGWNRSVRVGEIQNIVINLPLFVVEAEGSKKEFYSLIKKEIEEIIKYLEKVSELFLNPAIVNNTLIFKSQIKKRWAYLEIADCAYSISLAGINSAAEFLKEDFESFRKELLTKINEVIQSLPEKGIRIKLKEEFSKTILSRFDEINKRKNEYFKDKKIGEEQNSKNKLHKLLTGGHVCFFNKKDFNLSEFLKSEEGLAYVN